MEANSNDNYVLVLEDRTDKFILPQSQTWKDFIAGLEKQGITTRFKTKGNILYRNHL